jgi:hypothetical protein
MLNNCKPAALLLCAGALIAQDGRLPENAWQINLGDKSPVLLQSIAPGESRTSARGAAMVLDLHMALTLRNISSNRIHGVTLMVVSQEAVKGGKGSVTIPSLNIGPNESFPVRIDMQLMRPNQIAAGPLVQVHLDGVLYQDLGFFGPDRLHSQRYLTAYELEAQRDREYFKRVLAQAGPAGLQAAIFEVQQQLSRPNEMGVRVTPGGPAVVSAALPEPHPVTFALLQFPDSPVEPITGMAQVSGNEARTPRVEVLNKSGRQIKYVELGWILTDQAGRQSMAATIPSQDGTLYLPPGKQASVTQESTLRLFAGPRPANVEKMTGFVNQVQFEDGKVWVPSRQNLDRPELRKVVPPSAEAQRLSELYIKKGVQALVEELKKY